MVLSQSSLRNKLIAEAFYLTGEIEKYGTGFLRIEKELEAYPEIRFKFNEVANGLLASFEILEKKSSVKSSVKIIEIIKEDKYVTIRQIAEQVQISTRAVEKQIARLKKQGVIKRTGPAKGGHWEIIND